MAEETTTLSRQFTARQIAGALGVSRMMAHKLLADVPADGRAVISGNVTKTWSFASLPGPVQLRLEQLSGQHGRRNALHLLSDPPAGPAQESEPATAGPEGDEFPQTRITLSQCRDPRQPTRAEESLILVKSIEEHETVVSTGGLPVSAKRRLLELLLKACPGLAASRNALRVKFDRARKVWLASDCGKAAIKDRRVSANAARRRELSQEDRDVIVHRAVFQCGGRLSQAWRDCQRLNLLSADLTGAVLHNPASKSYVPNTIRRAVAAEIKMLMENHHGPNQTRDNGAFVQRCWDSVPALDWFNMDDATLPVYFYVPTENGGFCLMRGQFIVCIDTRSTCILGFALIPERNYNARVIRSIITRVCDNYGLPKRGFFFERGLWERSKILTGKKDADLADWTEAELGLREFGLEFKHAIRARSKPVERVIGALQDHMEGEPGYCGRNEQNEKFELVQKRKLLVESNKVHPSEFFYDFGQWNKRLAELCHDYNAEPQQGKHTGNNVSPEDALARYEDKTNPAVLFGPELRYLFACHKSKLRVGKNGITYAKTFNYKNEQTGKLRGQEVLLWFDPENPETATVTDLNRENPFCVARSQPVPALGATEEELSRELRRAAAHMGFAKTRYTVLAAKHPQQFRPMRADAQTIERGKQIEAGRAEASKSVQLQARARKVFGTAAPGGRAVTEDQVSAAEELARQQREDMASLANGG